MIPTDPQTETYDLKLRGGVVRLRYMSLRQWRAFCPVVRAIEEMRPRVRDNQATAEDLIAAVCEAVRPYVAGWEGLGDGQDVEDVLRLGEHWRVLDAVQGQNVAALRDAEKNSPSPSPCGTAAAEEGPADAAPAPASAATSPAPPAPSK